MFKRIPLCVLALTTAFTTVSHAQEAPEDEVRVAIQQLFDGMRAGDSAMVRAVLYEGVRMRRAMERNGTPALSDGSADGWLNAIGTPHDEVFEEFQQ